MVITNTMKIRDIFEHPGLKPYSQYAMFNHEMGKFIFNKKLKWICRLSRWNEKDMIFGLQRLADLAESGDRFVHSVYSDAEIKLDPAKKDVLFMHFKVNQKTPFVVVCAGGAYTSVCSMAEAYPVAARLNELGYNAFVVNYRVGGEGLQPKPVDDLAQTVKYIRDHAEELNVDRDNYIVTGYSAGGNLVNLYCSDNLGYSKYGLPEPKACFPIYSTVEIFRHKKNKEDQYNITALGRGFSEEKVNEYTVTKHLTKYPPAYIVACSDDKVVPVDQSQKLSDGLNKLGIKNICEIGDRGGHGFGLGTGTAVEGWPDRAIKFYESL